MISSLKSFATVLIVSAVVLGSCRSQAQEKRTYFASIPFEFHLSHGIMPAGSYEIMSLNSHMMRFRALGTTKTEDLLVYPVTESDTIPSGQLRFNRYGGISVLREFAAPANHSGLHSVSRCIPTRKEKQMGRNLKQIAGIPSEAQHPTEIAINVKSLP